MVGWAMPLRTVLSVASTFPIEGSAPASAASGRVLLADCSLLFAPAWSMLEALVLVAPLSSASLTTMKGSRLPALPGDVFATMCFKHTSLILDTSGSL